MLYSAVRLNNQNNIFLCTNRSLIWVTAWGNYMFRSGHQVPVHGIIGARTVDGATGQPHQRRIEEIDKNVLVCQVCL